MSGENPAGPLAGIRVLDCTQILSGPFAAALLGDLGADVVKIERPNGGDDVRAAGMVSVAGSSPQFHSVNRNKRSLALDIKSPEGREIMLELVRGADVLVENFRPGVMDRLDLGYDVLSQINPSLIFCSLTGFGPHGPYSDRPGFDLVAQGVTGLLSMTGLADGQLAKIGVPITDISSGMLAAVSVLAALHARRSTGRGQQVGTSLLRAGIAFTVTESSYLWANGHVALPNGTAHRVLAPYQAVRTKNGHILLACGNDRSFARLCQTLERPDLVTDPRFVDNGARVANRAVLIELLETYLRQGTSAEWIDRLNAAGCPCGPVNSIAGVFEDPQVKHAGIEVEVEHHALGPTRQLAPPFTFSDTPVAIRRAAPDLGQHSREVLAELGLTDEQIDHLIVGGHVRVPA